MKRLHLSTENKRLLGVCGGFSESTGIDADIFRLVFFISIFFGGLGIVVYFGCYLIFPTGLKKGDIIDVEVDVEDEDPEAGHRILRKRRDMMVAGVCSGLADYLKWDVSLVRILFIMVSLTGGIGIFLYAFFWFIFPLDDE